MRAEKSGENKKHKTQPSLSFDLRCCRSLAHYTCAPKAQSALDAESSLKHKGNNVSPNNNQNTGPGNWAPGKMHPFCKMHCERNSETEIQKWFSLPHEGCDLRLVSSRDSEVRRFFKWSDRVALLETAGLGIETWEELNNVYWWR